MTESLSINHLAGRILMACVLGLPPGEWDVAVLDHMFDLTFHGDDKQGNEVEYKDGPENWYVETLKQGEASSKQSTLHDRVPEFELR